MGQNPEPNRRPARVVILGGGVVGWMAAAGLAQAVGGRTTITLVDEGDADVGLGPFGAAETSLPTLRRFHQLIGLDEAALVCGGGASFGLGVVLTGWHQPGQSYIQPFGEVGAGLGPVAFHQLAGRLRAAGRQVRLADYSLAALLAQTGRFVPPSNDGRSVLSSYDYALHLDLPAYVTALRTRAERLGARRVRGTLTDVESREGRIAALRLAGGDRIEGDLFLDCAGASGRLIERVASAEPVDWSEWLPCDRVIVAERGDRPDPHLYAQSEARSAGWRRIVPLPGRVLDSEVFCSAFAGDDASGAAVAFASGRRREVWVRNCVALGGAAGLLEPVEPSALHLVGQAVAHLVALFPEGPDAPAEAAEYNRLACTEWDRARDFVILHHHANARTGEPFWDRARAMSLPDSLAYKIELYRSRGRLALYDEEVFEEAHWIMAFDEQGMRPRRYDALADGIGAEQLRAHFERLREVMVGAVRGLPPYPAFLRQLCAGARR